MFEVMGSDGMCDTGGGSWLKADGVRDGLGDRGLGSNRLPDTLSRRPSLVRHAHDGWGESRCGGVGWCDTLGDY